MKKSIQKCCQSNLEIVVEQRLILTHALQNSLVGYVLEFPLQLAYWKC